MLSRFLPALSLCAIAATAACKPRSSIAPPPPTALDAVGKSAPDITKLETLIGLPLKDAETLANKAGIRHRIVTEDGRPRPVTMDYLPSRLNFTVERGIITAVKNG